ncbi:MMPL/RND family transporter [Williamsia sterculiae]|nr:RND family transporter [Williamsia sterculiae]
MAAVIRVAAIPLILCWIVGAGLLNIFVPQLETVIGQHAQSFLPDSAPSVQAIAKMGRAFGDRGTNNFAYLVLDSDTPLNQSARDYNNAVIARLGSDKAHVISTMNLWGDPDLAAANQSVDGKAAYTLLNLTGNMGTAQAMASTKAVREVVRDIHPPDGVSVHITGPSAVVNDELLTVGSSILLVLAMCTLLVAVVLIVVYRSLTTIALPLLTVGIGLAVARPVVALLGMHDIIGVSIFASALMSVIVLGAGADYGVFLLGRYQEARRSGLDPESSYHTAMRGTQHIIIASGVTVAGATACMCFTRLSIFSTSGLPCTVGILVTLAAALTLGPALLAFGSSRGLFEPKPQKSVRRWRRIGTAVVRWPVAVLAASMTVLVVIILLVPTMRVSYDEIGTQPADTQSRQGIAAADRHFPPNIMAPSIVIVEADHDMRNPTDLLSLSKVTNAILAVPDVNNVQGITRPLGVPLPQATLPSQLGYIGSRVDQASSLVTQRIDDLRSVSDSLDRLRTTVATARAQLAQGSAGIDDVGRSTDALTRDYAAVVTKVDTLRETAEPAEDFVRSIPRCEQSQACRAALTGFSLFDDIHRFDSPLQGISAGAHRASGTLTELSATLSSADQIIDSVSDVVLPLQSALQGLSPELSEIADFADQVRTTFGQATPNDFYFIPREAFQSHQFARALPLFFSPDGKITRMVVTPRVNGFSAEAMTVSADIVPAAVQAATRTSLAGSTVSVGGPGGTELNIAAYTREDFITSIVAAIAFVLCVVLILLRSVIAAITVIGTVALSYLSALGMSILVWQYFLHTPLHWSVAPIAFIFLVAVGADYNLLLSARMREEWGAGARTGIIRSMANTGSVVTAAGLVFGFTMFGMLAGEARNVGQIGTVVGIGLLLDTLLVRSFVIPAIATLLGRWFWWPSTPSGFVSLRTHRRR